MNPFRAVFHQRNFKIIGAFICDDKIDSIGAKPLINHLIHKKRYRHWRFFGNGAATLNHIKLA